MKFEGAVAYIGLTDFFQEKAGNTMNVSLYGKEGTIEHFEHFAIINSKRKINRLKMPVEGKTLETNIKIITEPPLINIGPMDEGWLIKMKISNNEESSSLLYSAEYQMKIGIGKNK